MPDGPSDDCIILAADNDIRAAVEGLLSRPQAIPMRAITYEIIVHPQRDPGVRTRSKPLLWPYRNTHAYALAILDHEGSGAGTSSAPELEMQIEATCAADWSDRIRAIAIEPEVEAWIWSDSPEVDAVLGWNGRNPSLRQWLVTSGYVNARGGKPVRPKEAFNDAIRTVRTQRSPTIFRTLGEKVSVARCRDRGFKRLRATLHDWFPRPVD